jgi:hypothetical protein
VGVLLGVPVGARAGFTHLIGFQGDGAGNVMQTVEDVAEDSVGNVWVVGQDSDNVFRIAPDGTITEMLDATGDGLGNPLDRPLSIVVDSMDNVYVSGADSDNVFRITAGGAISVVLDASGDGLGNGFAFPVFDSVALDGADNVYVSGTASNNVFKITPGGVVTTIIDAAGDGMGNPLLGPRGVAVDAAGNVYVATGLSGSDNVFRITPGGAITELLDVDDPVTVALDGAGNAYVTSVQDDTPVFRIAPDDTVTAIVDATGDGVHPLLDNRRVSVNAAGDVYVQGAVSDNVFHVASGGAITQIIDATGDGEAALDFPLDALPDLHGNVWVSGFFSDNVFRVTPGGTVIEVLGPGGVGGVPVDNPFLHVGTSGALYVMTGNNLFRSDFVCSEVPMVGCRTDFSASKLVVRNQASDDRDVMRWRWKGGTGTAPEDLGDPLAEHGYAVCLYEPAGFLTEASVRGASLCGEIPCWKTAGGSGFRYRDPQAASDGVKTLVVKARDGGQAVLRAVAGGVALPGFGLPIVLPLTVQLQAGNGECWEATYGPAQARRNDPGGFKAIAP